MFLIYSHTFLVFLLLFPTPTPARETPKFTSDPITAVEEDYHSHTWHEFERFLGARRGSHVTGMSELKKYFQRFGYLPAAQGMNFTDEFDLRFEQAVVQYQTKLGLPLSGRLDTETLSRILLPRCGMSDTSTAAFHSTRHYAYFTGRPRWARAIPITLTYAFSPENSIGSLSSSEIRHAFRRAFAHWASVIPVAFFEAEDYGFADIKIGFYRGDHGDGEPFDGVLGILAHSFSPESGRLHLDAAETWAVDFEREKSKVAVDLESVATHEIGHVLGLAHTSVKEAVMYPVLKPREEKLGLKADDIKGIQALYGSNPKFKFASSSKSDISSNLAMDSNRVRLRSSTWITILLMVIFLVWLLPCM